MLLQEEVREEIKTRKSGEPPADHHGAPSTNYGGLGPSGRPFPESGGGGRKDNMTCHVCKQPGHVKKDCPKNKRDKKWVATIVENLVINVELGEGGSI